MSFINDRIYIRMCEQSPDIQSKCRHVPGDVFRVEREGYAHISDHLFHQGDILIYGSFDNYRSYGKVHLLTWLPRSSDLADMVKIERFYLGIYYFENPMRMEISKTEFRKGAETLIINPYTLTGYSEEQLLIQLVNKELFNKTWDIDSGTWIKEKKEKP